MMCGRAWTTTPLDFVDANGPGWAMKVQPFMGMPVLPRERPLPNAYKVQEYLLCLATLLFTGIHVAGWNFAFLTRAERVLRRVASLVSFGVTAAFWMFETMASWVRLERWTWLYLRVRD